MKIILSLLVLSLTACQFPVHFARVKPDKSILLTLKDYEKPVNADVFFNRDRSLELQVFSSIGGYIEAIIVNHRNQAVQIDFSKGYQNYARYVWGDKKPTAIRGVVIDSCGKKESGFCESAILDLPANQFARILIGIHKVDGEIIFPLVGDDKIVIGIKACSFFDSKCEAIK